ncbi:MAG: hypothetical protein E5Y58_25040, partial [Mesorhizobium sp.]
MAEAAKKAFVTGHPVAHSRSPKIHGYWLAKYGIDGTYRAEDLRHRFGAGVSAHGTAATGELLADAGLLVNTSALGMHGNEGLSADPARLPDHAIVTDIVYVPLETPLLAVAKARGLKAVDGLGMLLHQAVPG